MFAMMKSYLAVTVLLFLGGTLASAQPQSPEVGCASQLGEALTTLGPDFCDEYEEYVKCVLRERNLHILGIDRGYLRELQEEIDSSMTTLPAHCDVDIFELVREVRAEDLADAVARNVSHIYAQGVTEFDDATNIGECTNAYVYHVTNAGAITCEDTTAYTKCVVRTLALHIFELTDEQIDDYEKDLNATLDLLGLDDCVIDSQQLLENFRVMYTIAASVYTTTVSPISGDIVSSADRDVDSATTPQECYLAFLDLVGEGAVTCSHFQAFMRCFVRVLTLENGEPISEAMKAVLQENFDELQDHSNLTDCDTDIQRFVDEAAALLEVNTTSPFETATDTAGCTNAMIEKVDAGQLTCDIAIGFVTCIARVYNLTEADISDEVLESLERNLEQQWALRGLQCNVDLEEIIEELSGGTVQQVTSEPEPVSPEPQPVTPEPEPVSPVPVSLEPTGYACVSDDSDGCSNMVNGDYQACSSQCQDGIFVTCSNGYRYVNYCPDGWYRSPRGNPTTARLVFDPATGTCEYSTPHCPRPLDAFVLDQDS